MVDVVLSGRSDEDGGLVSGEGSPPVGWTYRGYLPHFDDQETPQFLTIRLADSVPLCLIEAWMRELAAIERGEISDSSAERNSRIRDRVEKFLDCGYGSCILKDPQNAEIVANALNHFDGVRYNLYSWVIMPNHLHALIGQLPGWSLARIVQNWKSFTAHELNKRMNRTGVIWQADYFDRYMRNEDHFRATACYIEQNPVTAGLCNDSSDWLWGSAGRFPDTYPEFQSFEVCEGAAAYLSCSC